MKKRKSGNSSKNHSLTKSNSTEEIQEERNNIHLEHDSLENSSAPPLPLLQSGSHAVSQTNLLVDQPSKWKNWWIRGFWTMIMVCIILIAWS